MWIGHRKEIRKLTFQALALRRSDPTIRPDEGLMVETSFTFELVSFAAVIRVVTQRFSPLTAA